MTEVERREKSQFKVEIPEWEMIRINPTHCWSCRKALHGKWVWTNILSKAAEVLCHSCGKYEPEVDVLWATYERERDERLLRRKLGFTTPALPVAA